MKYYIPLLLCLAIPFCNDTHAQSKSSNAYTKWKVTTKAPEIFIMNFPLSVERRWNKHTLGITLAYRPAIQQSGAVRPIAYGLWGEYQMQYAFNFLAEGMYAGLNSKLYPFRGRGENVYFDADVYYRRWAINGKYGSYDNDEGYSFSGTRNELLHVYGLKLLAGRTFILRDNGKVKWLMDIYAGPGYKIKDWKYENINGMVNRVYYPFHSSSGSEPQITMQGGLQFGIGF